MKEVVVMALGAAALFVGDSSRSKAKLIIENLPHVRRLPDLPPCIVLYDLHPILYVTPGAKFGRFGYKLL